MDNLDIKRKELEDEYQRQKEITLELIEQRKENPIAFAKKDRAEQKLMGFNIGVTLATKSFLEWLQDYLYGNALDMEFCLKKEKELKAKLGIIR